MSNPGAMGAAVGVSAQHGSSEQRYSGGLFGITPPGTPPASRPGTPTRPRSGFMRAPDDRRRSRERSRDREGREGQQDESSPRPMPQEWGGRTLRLERMIAELNDRVIQLSEGLTGLQNHCRNESTKLNAMENAIPERVHKIEERQNGQVELVNQMSTYTNVQLDAVNKRLNALEDLLNVHGTRPGTPGFGPEPKPAADRFSIGTPPQEPFAQARLPDPVTPPAQPTPADPWARYNNGHPTPHNNPPEQIVLIIEIGVYPTRKSQKL